MNSEEYIEVSVKLDPFSEEMAEIITAELSDLPFDSFVTEEPFLKCYIQKEAYRPSEVKVVLSGYPAATGHHDARHPSDGRVVARVCRATLRLCQGWKACGTDTDEDRTGLPVP